MECRWWRILEGDIDRFWCAVKMCDGVLTFCIVGIVVPEGSLPHFVLGYTRTGDVGYWRGVGMLRVVLVCGFMTGVFRPFGIVGSGESEEAVVPWVAPVREHTSIIHGDSHFIPGLVTFGSILKDVFLVVVFEVFNIETLFLHDLMEQLGREQVEWRAWNAHHGYSNIVFDAGVGAEREVVFADSSYRYRCTVDAFDAADGCFKVLHQLWAIEDYSVCSRVSKMRCAVGVAKETEGSIREVAVRLVGWRGCCV